MKNVLLSEIGNNIYIIEGSRRTDTAAKTAIDALCARGIISPDLAERAKGDRATLDKIKRNMECVMFEIAGDRWNFYTKSGLYMTIPANCEGYIFVESTERKPAAVPRKATKLYITFLCDTSAAKAGYKTTAYKSENKWFYEDENGHTWNILPAMLHNHDVIRIDGAEEAPTSEETPEPVQTTTTTESEPENAPQGTENTTGDQTPTNGEKTPHSATDGATTGGKTITDGKTITTDGATPASDPRQPDGRREEYHRQREGDHRRHGRREPYHIRSDHHTTPPRLRECLRTHGTSASRTSTHHATKNAATGQIQSHPRTPAEVRKNLCENQGSFRRIVFHRSRIGEVIHIGAFRSEKLTDFRTDSVGEKSPPPRGYQKFLR